MADIALSNFVSGDTLHYHPYMQETLGAACMLVLLATKTGQELGRWGLPSRVPRLTSSATEGILG